MNAIQPDVNDCMTLPRLRWQCRRGMLELDELLGRFLDYGYPELSPTEQRAFVALLETADPQLHDWFMARSQPPEPSQRALIAHILAVAQAAPHSR